ncbi:lipoyl(octanoyl) transferase LipB [Plectonema cf. radiosum LEGE 06105]|uniref:Octanoyltransferase n=1 Tax=Plectonema cf. radiosum LEGE 06105 TaxID=945769 RepID=A0A8J7JTM0_9CYAN|nr:lipoyl(octanoyl) transferase LipB [Plectonema radiosum]MBE9212335.1 lipoyl(octanoyl) transferase LipB [Plectonema cf. radiosum LEGE 06105]
MSATNNRCLLYNQAVMPYLDAWTWQQELQAQRIKNPSLDDALILLEHFPVYTLGRGATKEFLNFDIDENTYELHRIERGGEVTYHCPGQLVGYPILNLQRHRQDLHWYLRQLEEVLIRVLAIYKLQGERIPSLTGVWLEGRKVGAIGIKVTRWITMHGFSLNVCPDMKGFERIVPCGISDKPVASLTEWIPGITCKQVRIHVANCFAQVFNLELIEQPPYNLDQS